MTGRSTVEQSPDGRSPTGRSTVKWSGADTVKRSATVEPVHRVHDADATAATVKRSTVERSGAGATARSTTGRLTKAALRDRYRRIRSGVSPSVRADLSGRIVRNLCGSEIFRRSQAVALYAARGGEVDLSAAVALVRAAGKRAFFPRVCGDGLRFFEVFSNEELLPGSFGILEPEINGEREAAVSALDLIVVPGVCFDRSGHRAGSGRGFYDRALEGVSPSKICGAAYSFQVADFEIPSEPHDRRAGFIATEEGVFRARTQKEDKNDV